MRPYMCQISRQSDMAFEFYSSFCKCDKKKKNKKKKTKKLSQFVKSLISGMRKAISLKFRMWSAAVGGHVHSKNRLVSSRKHRATEVRNCVFFLPVNILTGVTRRLLERVLCTSQFHAPPPGVVGEYRGFDKSWCQIPTTGAKSALKSPLCPHPLVGDLTTP